MNVITAIDAINAAASAGRVDRQAALGELLAYWAAVGERAGGVPATEAEAREIRARIAGGRGLDGVDGTTSALILSVGRGMALVAEL